MRADCDSYPPHSVFLSSQSKTSIFWAIFLSQVMFQTNKNSHVTGCKIWTVHSVSFFYQFVELGIHRHTRIRTVSYVQQKYWVTLCNSKEPQLVSHIHAKYSTVNRETYPVKKSPKARCRRTTRHSQMCTHTQRYFRGTSTSRADEPKTTFTEMTDSYKTSHLFKNCDWRLQWLDCTKQQKCIKYSTCLRFLKLWR